MQKKLKNSNILMKYFNLRNLKIYFVTIIRLIKIFFLIKKKIGKNKKIKVLMFYFPVKAYNDNIIKLINILKKNKNFLVLLIYNKYYSHRLIKQKLTSNWFNHKQRKAEMSGLPNAEILAVFSKIEGQPKNRLKLTQIRDTTILR